MTEVQANRIYTILVNLAGAIEADRSSFVYHHIHPQSQTTEWRFGGKLGFGGKFWVRNIPGDELSVTCYSEDMNPARRSVISKTNAALAAFVKAEPEVVK